MAWEIPGFSWTRQAGEDLTDSQYCAVDLSGGEVVLPSAGGNVVGILRNKPDDGQSATIVTTGIVMVRVGTTGINADDIVTADSDGTIVQATAGDFGIGRALETTAPGGVGTVLLLLGIGAAAGS